jgi:hypothetical protein
VTPLRELLEHQEELNRAVRLQQDTAVLLPRHPQDVEGDQVEQPALTARVAESAALAALAQPSLSRLRAGIGGCLSCGHGRRWHFDTKGQPRERCLGHTPVKGSKMPLDCGCKGYRRPENGCEAYRAPEGAQERGK